MTKTARELALSVRERVSHIKLLSALAIDKPMIPENVELARQDAQLALKDLDALIAILNDERGGRSVSSSATGCKPVPFGPGGASPSLPTNLDREKIARAIDPDAFCKEPPNTSHWRWYRNKDFWPKRAKERQRVAYKLTNAVIETITGGDI